MEAPIISAELKHSGQDHDLFLEGSKIFRQNIGPEITVSSYLCKNRDS